MYMYVCVYIYIYMGGAKSLKTGTLQKLSPLVGKIFVEA